MNIRAKAKPNLFALTANAPIPYDQQNALKEFYDNAFRKWHFKVVFIIASLIGSMYALLLNSRGIFNWMTT